MLSAAASWQVQRYGASLIKNQAHFHFGQNRLYLNFPWNKTLFLFSFVIVAQHLRPSPSSAVIIIGKVW